MKTQEIMEIKAQDISSKLLQPPTTPNNDSSLRKMIFDEDSVVKKYKFEQNVTFIGKSLIVSRYLPKYWHT